MSDPWYLAVLPGDIIVVSMCNKDQVVYFSQRLECLQSVYVPTPRGLTVTPQGNALVASECGNCIYHLKGKVDRIECESILAIGQTNLDSVCANVLPMGPLLSVSLWQNELSVLFRGRQMLYVWK